MSATDIVLDVQGLTVDIATPRGTLHAVRDVSVSYTHLTLPTKA